MISLKLKPQIFMYRASIVLSSLLFFLPSIALAQFAGGDGSPGSPFQISDCSQLQALGSNLSSSAILINDIDCSSTATANSGAGFIPIGDNNNRYSGTFDGQDHIISDLTINRPSGQRQGLFGGTDSSSTIKNVRLFDVSLTCQAVCGMLIADVESTTVQDSFVSGTVSGGSITGGLVGLIIGATISRCSSNILNNSGVGQGVGGIAGSLFGGPTTISDTFSSGAISGGPHVGGIVGEIAVQTGNIFISRSYNAASVTSASISGGNIAGYVQVRESNFELEDSFGIGSVNATTQGGIIGDFEFDSGATGTATISNTYWDTNSSGQSSCVGTGTPTSVDCQPITGNATYFFNSTTNPPLDQFTFPTIWTKRTSDAPDLTRFFSITATVTPSPSPTITLTPSVTPTATHTASSTPTASNTPTATNTPDNLTEAPNLSQPVSGSSLTTSLNIAFTLPEAPLVGSVIIRFSQGATILGTLNFGSNQNVSITINPVSGNPAGGDITSATGFPLSPGTYTLSLLYQDAFANSSASSTVTNIQILGAFTATPTLTQTATATPSVTVSPGPNVTLTPQVPTLSPVPTQAPSLKAPKAKAKGKTITITLPKSNLKSPKANVQIVNAEGQVTINTKVFKLKKDKVVMAVFKNLPTGSYAVSYILNYIDKNKIAKKEISFSKNVIIK